MPPEPAPATAPYCPSPGALDGRVVFVTGAGSGIGRAAARACARAGATAILAGRDVPRLEETYDRIRADGGPEPSICPLDLAGATAADLDGVAARLRADFGRLDGLLHAAGQTGGLRPLRLLAADDWERLLRVNLSAPWLLTRACLPLLEAAPDPAAVFALDGGAQRAYWGAYGAAKAGLAGLVRILAEELDGDRPVRVNGIDPGPVETRLRRQNHPGAPPGAWPAPERVAPAFAYFLGADSREVTGRLVRLQPPEH